MFGRNNSDDVKKKVKEFKAPAQLNRMSKKASRKDDEVVAQYLTSKGEVKFKICKVIGGDAIVVNNKAHKIGPKDLWSFKKLRWCIVREIDRRPVSPSRCKGKSDDSMVNMDDYEQVRKDGYDTDSDVTLIKAVLGAIKKADKPAIGNKWVIFVIGGIVVIGILYYLFSSGGGA